MRLTARARSLLLLASCVILALFAPRPAAAAADSGRAEALRRCGELFGAPVDAARGLFEVDTWHVLEVKFDARGALSELNVVPKYFFVESHPEWEEPDADRLEDYLARDLTEPEYEDVLRRLDVVAPKGRLLKVGTLAVITNTTAPFTDYYERAAVTRGEVTDLRRGDHAPKLVKYVRVRFDDGRKLMKAETKLKPLRKNPFPFPFPKPEEKPND